MAPVHSEDIPLESPPATPRSDTEKDSIPDENEDDDEENGINRPVSIAISTHSMAKRPESLLHEACFLFVVSMAQFLAQTGLALSVISAHIIGKSWKNVNDGQLSWFAASFSLTSGTFILVAGRLGDLYGHRRLFIIGFFWYGLWSLLAGFSVYSTTTTFFIFCRAFQGIGAGLVLPNAIAILGRTYPPGRRKELVFSLFGATAPAGFNLAGVFIALLAQRAWWPWSYWIMAIFCFGLAVAGIFVIPATLDPPPKSDSSIKEGHKYDFIERIDIPGAMLGISGLVLINFSWNQAPIVGWTNPYTYALLIVGFLFLGGFGLVERKARFPLIPTSIFTGDLGWTLSCIAAGWASFGITLYYYYQFMEVIKGDEPLLAVGKWAAAPIMGVIAGLTTAYLLSRVSPSVIMFMAMSGFLISSCLMATIPVDQTYWAQAFVMTLIYPFGMYVDQALPLPNSVEERARN
ncbi:major facilitator superfamily domain, general substrate transporter [Trichoderma arundinaceum]|uniref:Major facilitator superfamily domain, general substrate transporter n=1 Tax=Trichoderma arundinaceum TaxID=490622 RepID=A0A395NPL7_TRIAR|nr:major facilitator superfamily domain, general substrate transporter [Trichoderma arundinaceum]